jgi:hypothetical protein
LAHFGGATPSPELLFFEGAAALLERTLEFELLGHVEPLGRHRRRHRTRGYVHGFFKFANKTSLLSVNSHTAKTPSRREESAENAGADPDEY